MLVKSHDIIGLRELSEKQGERVRFEYVDSEGKHTNVDTEVDSTTVRPDSILTFTSENGYKRYLFNRIQTDVLVGDDDADDAETPAQVSSFR